MDRATFLDALAAEAACWEDLLLPLSPAQLVAPAAVGTWSVRDTVAHVGFWTHHAAAHLVAIHANRAPTAAELYGQELPPDVPPADEDAVNAWILAQTASLPAAHGLDFLRQTLSAVAEAVAQLDDTILTDRTRVFPGLLWKGTRTLLEVLDILVLQHAAAHRQDIAAWRATQPPLRFDAAMRRELLAMQARDQEFRTAAMARRHAGAPMDPTAWAAIQAADQAHTARMRAIIAAHGWPGRSLVGVDGADAAWLLVQHADADVAFQEHCLALLAAAVDAGEATLQQLAYLTDRVRVHAGQPQVYGTQMRVIDGVAAPFPIADESDVDTRRAAVGLGPLADYITQMVSPS